MRFARKEMRDQHRLLIELGYTRDRIAQHGVHYVHPDFPEPISISHTPSDFRAERNFLAELKRRHPDHFEQKKSTRPKTKQPRPRRQGRGVLEAKRLIAAAPAPPSSDVVMVEQIACESCDYQWQSDIDPGGRPCPRCDSELVVVGMEMPRCTSRHAGRRCALPDGHLEHHSCKGEEMKWARIPGDRAA